MLVLKEKDEERFLSYINIGSKNVCWDWVGTVSVYGYGYIRIQGKLWRAHRLAFTIWKGEVPKNKVLDHLCRNRLCCNPNHLECTSIGENVLRGDTITSKNKAKNRCPKGHKYSGIDARGGRICHLCAAQRMYEKRHPEC